MTIRPLVSLSVVLVLFAAAPAGAQVEQLLGGAPAKKDVKVHLASGDPREQVQREKQALVERQQALIAMTPDLERWQTERKRLQERLGEVRSAIEDLSARMASEQEAVTDWKERERIYREWQESAAADALGESVAEAPVGADVTGGADAGPAAPMPGPTGPGAPEDQPLPEDGVLPEGAVVPEDAIATLETLAKGPPAPGPMPGVSHPGYRAELERLGEHLEVGAATLRQLVSGLNEERELVATSIAKADEVMAAFNERAARQKGEAPKTTAVSLDAARGLSYERYLAQLELSVARSRERALAQETKEFADAEAIELPELPEPVALAELPEDATERMRATFATARQVSTEADELAARIGQLVEVQKKRMQDILTARLRSARLDVLGREQADDELEKSLRGAIARIRITADDIALEKGRYDELTQKITGDIERVEGAIEALQTQSTTAGAGAEDGHFTRMQVREVQLAQLREEHVYHKLRLERANFVHEAYATLDRMLDGKAPEPKFLKRFGKLLDEGELARRLDEVGRRHEAWRRQHIQLAEAEADEGRAGDKGKVLDSLLALVEVCAKQEYVLESAGRLATVVRYHLKRFEREGRGTWWYVWRGAVSLAIAAVAFVLSMLLGRGSLRLSRIVVAHGNLAGTAAEAIDLVMGVSKARRGAVFLLYLAGLLVIWLGATFLALQVVWELELGLERVVMWLDTPLLLFGETPITVVAIGKLILFLLLAVWVARLLQLFLERQVFQFFAWDEGVRHAVSAVLKYIVLFVGVALGLESVGLGLGAFAVLLGVIGIGIGFGLQNIANNFISGFIILFERPVKKGDFIVTGELEGEVLKISARSTTIRTRDNVSVIVPNSEFISGRVVNWSHEDPRVRLKVPVSVAYGSDVPKVERVLLEIAGGHPEVISDPPSRVELTKFGDSAFDLVMTIWTRNIRARFAIVSDINKEIHRRFTEEGIEIPYPQREVRVVSGSIEPPKGDGVRRP